MSWTEKVHCPCRGATEWVIKDCTWTCAHCGAAMRVHEIEAGRNR